MDTQDAPSRPPPPPPPSKKAQRPKITLKIPDSPSIKGGPQTGASIYWVPPKYQARPPGTPASHTSGPQANPYFNPFMHMYHNKASDFMFKQFEGFKDFTMNTAKSGLSAGEKSAFWFYNKLRTLSKKWFTHIFLVLCLVAYSALGALMFMALEGPTEDKLDKNLTELRKDFGKTVILDIRSEKFHVFTNDNSKFVEQVAKRLVDYEQEFLEHLKHLNSADTVKKTWGFWNAMFYCGTIYTTIGKDYYYYPKPLVHIVLDRLV